MLVRRTFQLEVHEAMVWKGGKICRALSTFLVEWTLSGNRAKKSFLPKSDIAISKFVYVLEECEKRRKVDRETWSSSVAENYIRSSNEANWKRLSSWLRIVFLRIHRIHWRQDWTRPKFKVTTFTVVLRITLKIFFQKVNWNNVVLVVSGYPVNFSLPSFFIHD